MRGLLAKKRELDGAVGAREQEVAELQEDATAAAGQQVELEEGLATLSGHCDELEAQLREAIAREAAVRRRPRSDPCCLSWAGVDACTCPWFRLVGR